MKLDYEDIIEAIIGSAYEVQNIPDVVFQKKSKGSCPKDEPQLLNELKATEMKVGLLMNIKKEEVGFKCFFY